jgi:hypothetical protein
LVNAWVKAWLKRQSPLRNFPDNASGRIFHQAAFR